MISRLILLTLLTLHPDNLDDILNINNIYFDNMVSQIYPSEPQLNKANTFDTIATFWGCTNLSISNDIFFPKGVRYVHQGAILAPSRVKN